MKTTWRRRIRGAVGMGVAWGSTWLGAGLLLLLAIGPDAADVPFPLLFGLLGFLAGATFSLILGVVEGHRRFDELSLPRFAGWGAAGGFVLAVVFVLVVAVAGDTLLPILGMGSVFALAGAGSAAGSLAVARLADRPSLVSGADATEAAFVDGDESKRVRPGSRG